LAVHEAVLVLHADEAGGAVAHRAVGFTDLLG
jgi:hypothetical protein